MTQTTDPHASRRQDPPVSGEPMLDALIIGAGFSGLYQLHCLRDRLGMNVQLVEAAGDIGGTWYWNRYPGARCDSESHSYCYAFSDELMREWEWTERYPQPPEIRRYLDHVARKLDLRRSIRFNTRVTGARFDDQANLWRVQTDDGRQWQTRFLITAVGCLSSANIPAIEGLEDFAGRWYHTGEWPHEGVDFSGKRVGLIGTGSTGIQAAPVIAETAAHLTVFQRTANYSVPARNGPLSDADKHWMRENAAETRRLMHASTNGHPFLIEDRSALETPPEQRQALYEQAWERGGLRFRSIFRDLLIDKAANDTAAEFIRHKILETVEDPATAAVLADIDHPFAAKRPPIDTGYFETFNRANVSLVDIRAAPITGITAQGVCTTEREHPLDIIVFATGFDALTGPLLRLDITGSNGRTLADAWTEGPRNYLGLQVAGFPNLFTITGPGSPSVLCNMPVAIEQHVEWITDCLSRMRERGLDRIETTEQAVDEWVGKVNEAAAATLLPQARHSWYLGANVPGKPQVFMPYAGGMAHYRQVCADVAANGYRGFVISRASRPVAG
ncbi:MAG: NAD(P)/FAD-dependent oxidoreductase [Burkholderiaceae bacterium]